MNWLDGMVLTLMYGVPLAGGIVATFFGAWWFLAFVVLFILMELGIQTVHWVNQRFDADEA